MTTSSLPCVVLLIFLAASPLAGAWSLSCGSDGSSYAVNSTYEANLRRLAAALPTETAASPVRFVHRSIGYWPNRLRATSSCRSSDGDCAACIADAFKVVEDGCPFRREAYFFSRNCSLDLDEVRLSVADLFGVGAEILASGMIFHVIGLLCLFLMFLRAWRHDIRKGGTPLLNPETDKSAA